MAHSACRSYHSTNLPFSTKNALSDKQQTQAVIKRSACIIATANRTVKPHDSGNCTVKLFCGFLFVRLDVACRIGTDQLFTF